MGSARRIILKKQTIELLRADPVTTLGLHKQGITASA